MSRDTPNMAEDAVDLAAVSSSTFRALLGEPFREMATPLSLTLVAVEALPSYGAGLGRAEPFSLVFSGPPQPALPQGLCTLAHPALGRLHLFLVPMQPDTHGARYEAVFT